MTELYKGLPIQTTASGVERAVEIVRQEMSGKQYGLFCRFDGINRGLLRYLH